ncbi:MAG: zinc ribbon domain-containing protein [Elusimicrobiota bacterium]|nr:zinc ribbon domain-containing protein [Elusimicrobiota bacterium]
MEDQPEIPDNTPCPYCGAANSSDSEFCGACYKNLHIPAEVRAEVKTRKIIAAATAAVRAPAWLAGGGAPEAGELRPAVRLWGRVVIIFFLFLFYTRWLKNDNYFSPLDFVNLPFHEAGHVFLGFFGDFIAALGGTLFQLLIPAVCLVHLMRRGANLGWQLCLFWIGQSLLNISIYAGDAIKQVLPLVGGGGHDWTYLLTETGLIAHTEGVAKFIFFCGSAVIFYSFYLIARDARNRAPIELGNEQRAMR